MSNFQTLIRISIEHSYYSSGVCPGLSFYPTDDTQRLFQNAGLLCKKTADGIQLAYDDSRLEALSLYAEDEQEPLCFVFKVYSSDPEFKSYTEPFTNDGDRILYFDNRNKSGRKDSNILNIQKYVSNEDFRDLSDFSSRQTYKIDPDEIEDEDTDQLRSILTKDDLRMPPEFVLRIYARNNTGSLLKHWLEPKPTVYSIAFNARQRHWQYYLLGKMAKKDCYIVDSEQKIEFEAIGDVALADESIASIFRTKQSIPLSEHYPFCFQLKEKSSKGDNIVIDRLPVAGIRQVGRGAPGQQNRVASEIYINS